MLLYAEQELGDTLQLCRYAGPLAARSAKVLLQVQAPLVPLMASLAGQALVLARSDPLPRCDLQTPLTSLPMAFGTTLRSIPGDTPWYPTLRLLRQPALADWPGLVRRVRAALQALIG